MTKHLNKAVLSLPNGLCVQTSQRVPPEDIKTNTRKFLKNMRQRQSDAKQRKHIDQRIKSLQLNDKLDPTAIINSLHLLVDDNEYDSASDTDSEQ